MDASFGNMGLSVKTKPLSKVQVCGFDFDKNSIEINLILEIIGSNRT
jgi:hypothetical protein